MTSSPLDREAGDKALLARMLGGEPFSYSDLCIWAGERGMDETKTRIVDRTIQKLRRQGMIAFVREGGKVVWRPTATGAQ